MLQFSWLQKERKSNLKANPPAIEIFSFFQPPTIPTPNPPSDYKFWIFFPTTPTIPHPPSIRDIRVIS